MVVHVTVGAGIVNRADIEIGGLPKPNMSWLAESKFRRGAVASPGAWLIPVGWWVGGPPWFSPRQASSGLDTLHCGLINNRTGGAAWQISRQVGYESHMSDLNGLPPPL